MGRKDCRKDRGKKRVFRYKNSRNCIHTGDIGECTMKNRLDIRRKGSGYFIWKTRELL